MAVKPYTAVPEQAVSLGKGVRMQVLIGPEEAPNFLMRRFVIEPGGSMPKHTNQVEHEQFVLQGRARIGIGDKVYEVRPGDVVFIPAGVVHWYENVGEEPFVFLCMVPKAEDTITVVEAKE